MKSKNKQTILTLIIILATIALIVLAGSTIHEEQIKKNKHAIENIAIPVIKNEDIEQDESENIIEDKNDINEEYIGEEEQETEKEDVTNQTQSNDEKAIELAKKEWGEDNTVTFSIEDKKETKYYIAVKQDAIVINWYEVDIENWKIIEY